MAVWGLECVAGTSFSLVGNLFVCHLYAALKGDGNGTICHHHWYNCLGTIHWFFTFGHSPSQFSHTSLTKNVTNLQIHPYRGSNASIWMSQASFCLGGHFLAVFLYMVCSLGLRRHFHSSAWKWLWVLQWNLVHLYVAPSGAVMVYVPLSCSMVVTVPGHHSLFGVSCTSHLFLMVTSCW